LVIGKVDESSSPQVPSQLLLEPDLTMQPRGGDLPCPSAYVPRLRPTGGEYAILEVEAGIGYEGDTGSVYPLSGPYIF